MEIENKQKGKLTHSDELYDIVIKNYL